MFKNLDIFRMSHAMAMHAGTRQSVVAQNMANADTPGYTARDTIPFQAVFETEMSGTQLRATRPGHLHGKSQNLQFEIVDRHDAAKDPNGNSVSLETEMLAAVDVKRQHDRALAIYKSGLGVLRSALGRR
jgi:flagellar basal-body rod protein FlgB